MLTRRTLLASFLVTSLPSRLCAATGSEDEINALIHAIETSGCQFMRNGDSHSALEAAEHLRLKYRKGKSYAPTAEAFIENLASKSSLTQTPYYLVTPQGEKTSSGDWLRKQLILLRTATPTPVAPQK